MSENLESLNGEVKEGLFTCDQMAEYLSVKLGTLKDWTKLENDPCPCYRYKTRVLRFDRLEVLEWFKRQSENWKD